jgi:DNA polymerase I-like protein with 3'-5' exonuclease and polymerase domains
MSLQTTLFDPNASWSPPASLPNLTECKEFSIDLETRDPNLRTKGSGWARKDGEIIGVAVAWEGGRTYLPFSHLGGGNLDKDIVYRWLKKQLESNNTKVFHNAAYDLGWLTSEGFTVNGKIVDTLIAAPLLDEHSFSYSLDNLGEKYCNQRKSENLLDEALNAYGLKDKGDMWKLPAKYVGIYAEQDASLTLDLWKILKEKIQEENLTKVFQTEMDIVRLVIEMRMKGVRVDLEKAEKTMKDLTVKEQAILLEIKREYGVDVDIWANASIQQAFDKINLYYPYTEKGSPSFQANWLENHEHDLPRAIARARKYNKAGGTFIKKMIFDHEVNGRIHAEAHSSRSEKGGTVTGRFSYSNPNLQQVPARDPEIGPMIRSIFIPDDGEEWCCFDYSQQEPRITVHYASRLKMTGADQAVRSYLEGNADFHQIVADMANIPRKQAKNINLGLTYGMGVKKLINELGVSEEEGNLLLSQYHTKVPFIKGLMDYCTKLASDRGYIKTLGGRKARFDLWEPNGTYNEVSPLPIEKALDKYGPELKRAFTYKALNRLIQGSAADMTKLAMLEVRKQGIIPLLQVHDELDFSLSTEEQKQTVKEAMINCVNLSVPMEIDMEIGKSWGEIK